MKTMNKMITIGMLVALTGCAKQLPTVPYVENYPESTQKKMQAAHHWDLLAEDVAERLQAELQKDSSGKLPKVYVRNRDQSPFAQAFHSLLLTRLNDKGFALSEESRGGLILEYDTQVVRHEGRGVQRMDGAWTALGAGAWVLRGLVSSGTDTAVQVAGTLLGTAAVDTYESRKHKDHLYPQPDTEIIVSVSMKHGKNIIARTSDIYYINDPDDANYQPINPIVSREEYAQRKFVGMKNLRVNK